MQRGIIYIIYICEIVNVPLQDIVSLIKRYHGKWQNDKGTISMQYSSCTPIYTFSHIHGSFPALHSTL